MQRSDPHQAKATRTNLLARAGAARSAPSILAGLDPAPKRASRRVWPIILAGLIIAGLIGMIASLAPRGQGPLAPPDPARVVQTVAPPAPVANLAPPVAAPPDLPIVVAKIPVSRSHPPKLPRPAPVRVEPPAADDSDVALIGAVISHRPASAK